MIYINLQLVKHLATQVYTRTEFTGFFILTIVEIMGCFETPDTGPWLFVLWTNLVLCKKHFCRDTQYIVRLKFGPSCFDIKDMTPTLGELYR